MSEELHQKLELLDSTHEWPCPYLFKFIVPSDKLTELCELFTDYELSYCASRTGKFTSVTMESTVCSGHEVLAIYQRASLVEGVFSL